MKKDQIEIIKQQIASREIKFRGWNGREIVEDLITFHEESNFSSPVYKMSTGCNVIMQFTGLLDKNSKEIWEGDVVVYQDEPHVVQYVNHMGGYALTSYSWNHSMDGILGDGTVSNKYYEVIGNIFEHPNLLSE